MLKASAKSSHNPVFLSLLALWLMWGLAQAGRFFPGWQSLMREVAAVCSETRPAWRELLLSAGTQVLLAIVVFAFALSLLAIGSRVLVLFGNRTRVFSLDHCLLSFMNGIVVLGTSLLGLGLAGLFCPPVLLALLPLAVVSAAVFGERPRFEPQLSFPRVGWRYFALGPSLIALLLMFAPDVWVDTLQYHMAASELYLRLHRIVADGVSQSFQYPILGELIFAFPLILKLNALAHFIDFLPYLAAVGLLALEVKSAADGRTAWLVAIVALTMGLVLSEMTVSKNSLVAASFPVAGAASTIRGLRAGRASWIFLGAFLLGAGAAVKPTGYVALAVAWLFAETLICRARSWNFRARITWMLLALAPVLPWMAKNWLSLGNPLWPFLSSFFPQSLWDGESQRAMNLIRSSPDLGNVLLTLPAETVRFWLTHQPLVIWILPLSLLGLSGLPRAWKWLGLCSLSIFAALSWLYPSPPYWYTLPAWVLFAAAVSVALFHQRVASRALVARALVPLAVVSAWLPMGKAITVHIRVKSSVEYILGAHDPSSLYAHLLTTYWDTKALMESLPIEGYVLLGETRMFLFPGRCLTERFWGRNPAWVLVRECDSAERIRVRFRQMNCRHLVYNFVAESYPHLWTSPYVWDRRMISVWSDFVGRHLDAAFPPRQVDQVNGGFCVFAVRDAPLPSAPAFLPYLPGLESMHHWVTIEARRGDARLWRREARKLHSQLPNVGSAVSRLAFCLRKLGQYEEAYPLYRELTDRGVIEDDTWMGAAICASELGKDEEALRYAGKAMDLYPEWKRRAGEITARSRRNIARSCNNSAYNLWLSGRRLGEAFGLAKRAVSTDPTRAAYWDTLAVIQIKMGRRDEARISFRRALSRTTDERSRGLVLKHMKESGLGSPDSGAERGRGK